MGKQHPLLVRSGLTNTVYVVTRYKDRDDQGHFEALEKYDVTDQFDALIDNELETLRRWRAATEANKAKKRQDGRKKR